jgi:hypothetical protein
LVWADWVYSPHLPQVYYHHHHREAWSGTHLTGHLRCSRLNWCCWNCCLAVQDGYHAGRRADHHRPVSMSGMGWFRVLVRCWMACCCRRVAQWGGDYRAVLQGALVPHHGVRQSPRYETAVVQHRSRLMREVCRGVIRRVGAKIEMNRRTARCCPCRWFHNAIGSRQSNYPDDYREAATCRVHHCWNCYLASGMKRRSCSILPALRFQTV